ncbi:hypothetical protein Dimus_039206 [Dionaea muscipula]
MILSCWNIRGFNRPLKQEEVKRHAQVHHVDVIAILETKIPIDKLDGLMQRRFPSWSFTSNFSCHLASRILILWKPDKVDISVLRVTAQLVHCKVVSRAMNKEFFATFAYGLYSVADRRGMWEDLATLGNSIQLPWVMLGDFNAVNSRDKKLNGAPISNYELHDQRLFEIDRDITDMRYTGCKFTCPNNTIWCKLDRVLTNSQWSMEFPNTVTKFLSPGIVSDHSLVW